MRNPGAAAVLGLCVWGAPSFAGQQGPAIPPLTEFVDFIAVSDQGKPVTDLGPSDITLRIDGRPRPVTSLQFVQVAPAQAIDRGTDLAPPLPQPYGSNRLEDIGRLVIIAIDRESIRPGRERPAREAALKFLSGLSGHDRVGLVSLPRVDVEPTTDHSQVREKLATMTGLSPQERTASEAACHGRLVLNTLSGLLNALATVDGPKTIAFISTGLPSPNRDAPMTGAPGQCEVRSVYFDEVGQAASAARAHLYVIQPNDEGVDSAASARLDPSTSRFRSADDNLAGLQHLASIAGRPLYRLSVLEAEKVFTRLADESSAYYVVAFEPEAGERNGLPHRVEVKVLREGVTVRSQPHVTIARSDMKPGDITPQKMLREARVYRDLALRTTAYASMNAGDSRLKVIAAAEPLDPAVTFSAVAVGLFDAKGKLAAQWTADKEDLSGRPLIAALAGNAGLYRLRVAAVDAAGRRGTVDYHFRAELENAGPLKLSAMALGVMRPGFRPRLQFGPEDAAAIGYFELYGVSPRGSEITVRMEISATRDGEALVASAAKLQTTEDEARRIVIAPLALAPLPPGDYVVCGIVSIDGRQVGRVYRTLRKVRN